VTIGFLNAVTEHEDDMIVIDNIVINDNAKQQLDNDYVVMNHKKSSSAKVLDVTSETEKKSDDVIVKMYSAPKSVDVLHSDPSRCSLLEKVLFVASSIRRWFSCKLL
jgi:hypothetical protein